MYHDLRTTDDFANWLRVPTPTFHAHLADLKAIGRFVTPGEAAYPEALPGGRPHFLLTFDDGYANNLQLALPILEQHRVPALFFISTGPMQSQQPFWFDVIVTAIQAAELTVLDLREYGLGLYRFRAMQDPRRWADIDRLLVDIKNLGDEDHAAIQAVLAFLSSRFAKELESHLKRFRPLAPEEVRQLARSPWGHIGSHGHDHRILTRAGDEELRGSLVTSRRLLEELSDGPVVDLAYPNGDHDERVIAAARQAGYLRGYTTVAGFATSDTASMMLPRIGVDGVGPPWLLRYRLSRGFLSARLSSTGVRT